MKRYVAEKIRNLGIVGHGGTGKTSLSEALLYTSGAITKQGKIEEGNTAADYDPDEIKRHISLHTSLAPCEWKDHKINIIDTPGYADFIGEVIGPLRVVEGILVVVDAVAGVEVQTEILWSRADDLNLPKIVFINGMDKDNADFTQVLSELKQVSLDKKNIIPFQLPIGKASQFKGVVDLVNSVALTRSQGKSQQGEIPEELKKEFEEQREQLIEAAAEGDDELLEKYLEAGELNPEEIKKGLKLGFVKGEMIPVLCGSATRNVGTESLLDTILDYFPNPSERPEVIGKNLKTGKEERRKTQDKNFSALVFKTMADPYVGRLSYIRIFSGILKPDSIVYNSTKKTKQRISHLYLLRGKNQEEFTQAEAGDIVVAPKLEATDTGNTLCDESSPIVFEPIVFPEPVVSFAVEPKARGDEEKLSTSLSKLAEEDKTLKIRRDHETKQTIVSGMGDLHIEVLTNKLERKFGVAAALHPPKIPYKETIRSAASAQGKYKKQTGGRGQYGDVWLKVEPLERGAGFEFVNQIKGGVVPTSYIPAVEKGLHDALEGGIIAEYPVVDIKVSLYDGSFHPVDSSEMAFKIAASLSFKKALKEADPILLEPIANIEVTVPDDLMGDVIGDLSGKRGKILGMEPHGRNQKVKAQVPLAEISRYATELRSITHGKGIFTMNFSHYEEVPPEVSQKIATQAQAEAERRS